MFSPSHRMLALPPSTLLFLDVRGEGTTFISHAHADHAVRSASRVVASRETMALLKCRRYVKKSCQHVEPNFTDVKVSLLDAGHVFGSRQILVENGSRFLYTGDLALSPSLTAGQAVFAQCDELFIECTYGSPRYIFPPRMEVGEQLAKWALANEKQGCISIIGGYSLGKAQEVIAHLNQAGITPVVHRAVAQVSKCYVDLGCKLDFIPLETPEGQNALRRGFTAVFPMQVVSLELAAVLKEGYGRDVRLATCSGWALDGSKAGVRGFPLSDHADFNELLKFVQETNAKKVYCAYGSAAEFAYVLRRRGIEAVSIETPPQPREQQVLSQFITT